jgi:hypothetical protein
MPSFSLRTLILVAIGAILIFRMVHRFGANRSGRGPTAGPMLSPGNAFCTHCGVPLVSGALFCGACGFRQS